jgi:hypothetical protein
MVDTAKPCSASMRRWRPLLPRQRDGDRPSAYINLMTNPSSISSSLAPISPKSKPYRHPATMTAVAVDLPRPRRGRHRDRRPRHAHPAQGIEPECPELLRRARPLQRPEPSIPTIWSSSDRAVVSIMLLVSYSIDQCARLARLGLVASSPHTPYFRRRGTSSPAKLRWP